MSDDFYQNARLPIGEMGRAMLERMNERHKPLSLWGLSHINLSGEVNILDIGCGGGANIYEMLTRYPQSHVCGIDYSEESVAMSRETNSVFEDSRFCIEKGDASALPYGDNHFDAVTAFETVYFWGNLDKAFAQVYRVLKTGGVFLIVCELSNPDNTQWTDIIDGMKIYSGENLESKLNGANFKDVKLYKESENEEWICLTGIK